jgi:hypothetical protein
LLRKIKGHKKMFYNQQHSGLQVRTWYPFDQFHISQIPHVSGVYWLGAGDAVRYIGSSIDLHQRLNGHHGSPADYCIAANNQFAIDPRNDYWARERQLLIAYLSENGRLPDCNDKI